MFDKIYKELNITPNDFTKKLEEIAYDKYHAGGEEEVFYGFKGLVIELLPFIKRKEEMKEVLKWYLDETKAISKALHYKMDNALEASLNVLALDNGSRAEKVLKNEKG